MTPQDKKSIRQRVRRFGHDLSVPNRVIAGAVLLAIPLEILGISGLVGQDNPFSEGILVFALLSILAVNLDLQVQQVRIEAARSKREEDIGAGVDGNSRKLDVLAHQKAPFHVEGSFIKAELGQLLNPESTFWKFRGGSGRWQRTHVLPSLAGIKTRDVTYKMLILDPRNEELCERYARYRNTHRGATKETTESVQYDLLACIVSAAWYSAKSRIKPFIYLNQTYSPLRVDLGNAGAMMTVSDPDSPGLLCHADSWFYQSLDDEFERALEQSPTVTYHHAINSLHLAEHLTIENVRIVLERALVMKSDGTAPLFSPAQINQFDLEEIAVRATPSSRHLKKTALGGISA